MKTLLSTAIVVTLASGAFAGNSDRYNDNHFDSAKGHVTTSVKETVTKQPILSTSGKKAGSYAYTNPYGVGPNNDSR